MLRGLVLRPLVVAVLRVTQQKRFFGSRPC